MADKKQDNGPYSVYGRRTEHEAEVRIGSYSSLVEATDQADALVDSGVWHQATARDRNDQTVHVSNVAGEQDRKPDGYDPTDTGGGPGAAA